VFYVYIWDAQMGPGFIKICTYFPYPVKVWVNGHEWAKQQARKAGLGFTELSNGFASCEDPALLQRICDALTPGAVQAWFDRWMQEIPLPLDAAEASPVIPAHLRRAAAARHPTCAFAGCDTPASACHIHHLVPRSAGGPTSLANIAPFCAFHHLVVIHRWGWKAVLNPDGTTTATSPDGVIIHSHSPPARAA